MDKIAPLSPALRATPVADATNGPAPAPQPVARPARPASPERPAAADNPVSVAAVVEAIIAQGPPIDLDKIARVRADIARGTYVLDPDRIAAAMVKMGARDA